MFIFFAIRPSRGNGFRIIGIDANDYRGWFVSSAGDVSGDGYDDFIVGADKGDPGAQAKR